MKKLCLMGLTFAAIMLLLVSCVGMSENVVEMLPDDAQADKVEDVDSKADAEQNADDMAESEAKAITDMTDDELIEYLMPYVDAYENETACLPAVETEDGEYLFVYDINDNNKGWDSFLHLVKSDSYSREYEYLSKSDWSQCIITYKINDWTMVDNQVTGEYTVSGDLFNTFGENIGGEPWEVMSPDTSYCELVTNFSSKAELAEYLKKLLPKDKHEEKMSDLNSNYIDFDGKLYRCWGARGYLGYDYDYEGAYVEIGNDESCTLHIKQLHFIGDHHYIKAYNFGMDDGRFVLLSADTVEAIPM